LTARLTRNSGVEWKGRAQTESMYMCARVLFSNTHAKILCGYDGRAKDAK